MAHITISAPVGIKDNQLVMAIRSITGDRVSEISAALLSGLPLFDGDVFARPREESISKVMRLLNVLNAAQITPVVREAGRLISADILLNIIQSSINSMAEFDRLSDFGHEA